MVAKKLVPPDGGYGWIVACAFSIHHMIVIPIGNCFGLVFKDRFKDLGFSATDITLIVNTNIAFAQWCGIINGVLLKHLGYRKIALLGASLMTIGVFLTAYADTFTEYLILHGLVTAFGMGMGISSYPFAVNTFFTKKRTKVFGYAMTVSGLGPVLLPQIISLLLTVYDVRGTVIVLSGIACNTFVSALLLQPIKWHMTEESEHKPENLLERGENNVQNDNKTEPILSKESNTSTESRTSVTNDKRSDDQGKDQIEQSIQQRKSYEKFESEEESLLQPVSKPNATAKGPRSSTRKSLFNSITHHIVNLFDLTLLKDLTFVNIIIGISLGVFSEKSFSTLTPFIMQDYGLDTQQTATFMSTISIVDICFRFVAPHVSDFFRKPVRVMYVWSVIFLVIFRCGLLITDNYTFLLIIAVLMGLARGFRMIYWMLVIPSYVPIERLASAAGLQSVLNGLVIWFGGPFLGMVKDLTGSFKMCVLVINLVTFLSVIMWVMEFGYKRCTNKKVKDSNVNP